MSIYYVDYSAGDDGENGLSEGAAWKTINKVNASMGSFNPGDYILFQGGDTWPSGDDTLQITCQGTSGNQITFGSYGTGKPKFVGNNIQCNSGNGYLTIDNIEVAGVTGDGITFYKTSGWQYDVFIQNCLVYNSSNVGIIIQSIDGYLIHNCEVYSCNNGNIYVYGSDYPITNGTVSNCTSYNAIQNDGVSIHEGDSLEACGANHLITNCTCYGCAEEGIDISDGLNVTVRDCDSYGNTYAGYIIEGHGTTVIERCKARDGYMGMHIGQSDLTIKNCLIYNNGGRAIIVEPYGSISGINVYNNTLAHPDVGNGGSLILIGPYASNMNWKNNIIMTKHDTNPTILVQFGDGLNPTNTNMTFDYNCYYHPVSESSRFYADDTFYSFSSWKSTYGQDAHSIFQDPAFVDGDNDNYRLSSSSPCKDIGVNLGILDDYYETARPQGQGYDVGAIEYPEQQAQGKPVYEAFNVRVEE